MRRLFFGIAVASALILAGSIHSPVFAEDQAPAAEPTCETVSGNIDAVKNAQNFDEIVQAMLRAGFPTKPNSFEEVFKNDLEVARARAIMVLEVWKESLCQE